MPKTTYALYETDERINKDGGGGAQSKAGSYPVARYRATRGGEIPRRRFITGQIFERPTHRWYDRWGRLTVEGKAAYEWLLSKELLRAWEVRDGKWRPKVAAELCRRAWLEVFRLDQEDVPFGCCYKRPWQYGYDPDTVKAEKRDREQEIAIEKAVLLEAARAGRGRRLQSA